MIYGLCDRARVEATPGARAECPSCGGVLVAKCGQLVRWHFAHKAKDCDAWSEGESAWHLDWKDLAPPERREVVRGPHRADLVGPGGGVIELQHSSISVDEIEERERFYGKMVWVFDAIPFEQNFHIRDQGEFLSFLWSPPRPSFLAITKPLFLDFGEGRLLEVRKLDRGYRVGGWGYYRSQRWFCRKFLGVDEGSEGTDAQELTRWSRRRLHVFCGSCGESHQLIHTTEVEWPTVRTTGERTISTTFRCPACAAVKGAA